MATIEEVGKHIEELVTTCGYPCKFQQGISSARFVTIYLRLDDFTKTSYLNKYLTDNLHSALGFPVDLIKHHGQNFGIRFAKKETSGISLSQLGLQRDSLAVPIGLDAENNPVRIDFTKSAHVLVAGATGSGKSVAMKTIIDGIFYQTPLALVHFIDPKIVEFSRYGNIHSNLEEIDTFLESQVESMNNKYDLANYMGWTAEEWTNKMGHIYIVIDELADIILSQYGKIEENLIRLAQKGRGVGYHLIMATQNPLVKVFNSLLKANTTTRICLKCANAKQSMCILDHGGGESLLGCGDALIKLPTQVEEVRFQVALTPKEWETRLIAWRNRAVENSIQQFEKSIQ